VISAGARHQFDILRAGERQDLELLAESAA
jgi:hypothetical protein